MVKNENHYDADDIVELKYPYNVRDKIGMYLGNSGQKGFSHTFTEIFDNSIDEFVAGHGDKMIVSVDSVNNIVRVRDFGRGIPYTKNKEGVSSLTLALTVLHAGGKHANDIRNSSYKYSSGVHGVGASVVQAASNFFNVIVYRGDEKAYQKFENGLPVTDVVIIKRSEKIEWEPEDTYKENGTYIEYQPSVKKDEFDRKNVFDADCKFEKEWFLDKLKYTTYMNIGLEIFLKFDGEDIIFDKQKDVRDILKINGGNFILEETQVFKEELVLLLSKETKTKKVVNIDSVMKMTDEEFDKWELKASEMELAFNFKEEREPTQLYFVNGVLVKGGKQEQALKLQMKRFINEYVKENRKNPQFYETEDIFGNFSFMFSVKLNEPKFSGQTKEALDNVEVTTIATAFLKKYLQFWFSREDKKKMDLVIRVIDANKKAREASNKIKENVFKEVFSDKEEEIFAQKGKLEDCRTRDREKAELFIVEGDSAGGSAKQSKSHEYQALLPLKGKPLNTLKKKNLVKIFKNEEIISLITALETGVGDKYQYDKLRYNKIIIMADADVDGQHINALMLSFFFNIFRELIELGHVYVVLSPLYKIILGKEIKWAWNKEELEEITRGKRNFQITRHKGLGEMEPEELWDTTLNPVNRKLVQIRIEDFEKEKDKIEIYMGDDEAAKKVLKNILSDYYLHLKNNEVITLSGPDKLTKVGE